MPITDPDVLEALFQVKEVGSESKYSPRAARRAETAVRKYGERLLKKAKEIARDDRRKTVCREDILRAEAYMKERRTGSRRRWVSSMSGLIAGATLSFLLTMIFEGRQVETTYVAGLLVALVLSSGFVAKYTSN